MRGGKLDRRVQFERFTTTDNGFEEVKAWAAHGQPVWASKTPLSDRERWMADQKQAVTMARFVLRYSDFTADLTVKDRLICDGLTYGIEGIKEIGRRRGFEITGAARVDA